MSEDISFLIERLQCLIPEAIMTGIQQGFETKRRRILYRVFEKVPLDELKVHQVEGAYGYSKEQYEGVFLEFAHFNDNEVESEAIIERPDGTVVGCALSQIQFIK